MTTTPIIARPLPAGTKIRLLACDLDGTLISRDQKINDTDLAAVHRLQKTGVRVAICTGRSIMESTGAVAALALDGPGVFVTGAVVNDMASGKALLRRALPSQTASDLIDFFSQCGHAVLTLIDQDTAPGPYYAITSHGPVHAATREWFVRHQTHAIELNKLDSELLSHIIRISIVVNMPETPGICRKLQARFGDQIYFLSIKAPLFDCHVLEVFAPHVNKWSGIESLCKLLDIPADSVATIGDDINDVPMLRQSALSFAMATAGDEIKSAAKRITLSQPESGVAAAIEQILLENHM